MAIFPVGIPYSLQKAKNLYCRDFSLRVATLAGLQYMFALQLHIYCFHDDVTKEQADRKFRYGFQ